MKTIILAAGTGQRLGQLTSDRPKALVEVAGQPLLAHMLDFLNDEQITDITVVGGYHFNTLREWLQAHAPHVQLVYNPRFMQGSIHSLLTAPHATPADFLLCNVDHIYHPRMLSPMIRPRTHIAAACDFDRPLGTDDMKVELSLDGQVLRMHKELTKFHGGYIGMTRVPANQHAAYWDAAQRTLETHGDRAVAEWVLSELASTGTPINVCDLSEIGWAEVDTREDLAAAEMFLRQSVARAA